MTLLDICCALNRGESIEITCHEGDANRLRLRFFKQVATMPASTAPLYCETLLLRGQVIRMHYPEAHLSKLVQDSLKKLREHAGLKTGLEGLEVEPKELI